MMTRDDPDRIIKDCTDMINHLLSRLDLRTEQMKLHYCRGRTLYYKGEIESDKGSFHVALSDFLKVAQDRIRTNRDLRSIAWHFCGLCCQSLGQSERSECYFDKARKKGFDADPAPFYLEPIIQEVEEIKKRVHQKLGITEGSE